jgi:hypothetical protein
MGNMRAHYIPRLSEMHSTPSNDRIFERDDVQTGHRSPARRQDQPRKERGGVSNLGLQRGVQTDRHNDGFCVTENISKCTIRGPKRLTSPYHDIFNPHWSRFLGPNAPDAHQDKYKPTTELFLRLHTALFHLHHLISTSTSSAFCQTFITQW